MTDELLKQLYDKPFRRMLFSVFNVIDDDGFVREIGGADRKSYDIDDFEFMSFDLSDEQKKGVRYRKRDIMLVLNEFKYHVEKELQEQPARCRIFIMKEYSAMVAVKLKDYVLPIPSEKDTDIDLIIF